MALIKDYEVPTGTNIGFLMGQDYETVTKKTPYFISNAYIKIMSVVGTKEEIELSIGIKDGIESTGLITGRTYRFTPSVEDDSPNFIKQGYEYLKSLPDFENAIDA